MSRGISVVSWLIIASCLLLSPSCKYSSESQAVNANNEFSLVLPSWLSKEDNLKPGASLQYANRYRNFYVIGHSLSKGENTPVIANKYLDTLRHSLQQPVITDSAITEINSLPAFKAEIYGKMNNENIYFTEMVVAGKKRNYHISIWTRGEERKLRFKGVIDSVLYSFREI